MSLRETIRGGQLHAASQFADAAGAPKGAGPECKMRRRWRPVPCEVQGASVEPRCYPAPVRSVLFFLLAGLCEIGGGYLVWIWLRERKPLPVGVAGFAVLALYGVVPTLQPPQNGFGRVYAAYGAVFIVLSLLWGWSVDGQRPDLRDAIGSLICLAGAAVMMWPRAAS